MAIDFPKVAGELLQQSALLLREWLPAGKKLGNEWKVGNIHGEAGESLSINMETGIWKDFAGDAKGGDLISLYAAIHNITQSEAVKRLKPEHYSNGHAGTKPTIPPACPGAAAVYRYTDTVYVARYERADKSKTGKPKKDFKPWVWTGHAWMASAPEKPRPIFGLDELAAHPKRHILIVEGEKCVLAAQPIMAANYTVLSWMGGAEGVRHADWSPIRNRGVVLWPDADPPPGKGQESMRKLAAILHTQGCSVRIVDPYDWTDGRDIADAIADGWGVNEIATYAKERISAYEPRKDVKPLPAGTLTGTDPTALWAEWGLESPSKNAQPYSNASNVAKCLENLPEFVNQGLWFDTFRFRPMTTWECRPGESREWRDTTDTPRLLVHMQNALAWPKLAEMAVKQGFDAFIARKKRHPLIEYLDSLKWDKTERLTSFIPKVYGSEDIPYTQAVGRCWLVSMVARAYDPGCKVDTLPVLEGYQGAFKSTTLDILGGEFYAALPQAFGTVDYLQNMDGVWLAEIPDMSSFQGRDLNHVKAFITIRNDRYRRSYGRRAETWPRQTVFAATANSNEWNDDETGARRMWPIKCEKIDLEYLTRWRDQFFAEAVVRYKRGESWWDVPAEAAVIEQEARWSVDPWHDAVQDYCRLRTQVSVHNICDVDVLNIPMHQRDKRVSNRLGKILRKLGYENSPVRINGMVKKMWLLRKDNLPTEPAPTEELPDEEF